MYLFRYTYASFYIAVNRKTVFDAGFGIDRNCGSHSKLLAIIDLVVVFRFMDLASWHFFTGNLEWINIQLCGYPVGFKKEFGGSIEE